MPLQPGRIGPSRGQRRGPYLRGRQARRDNDRFPPIWSLTISCQMRISSGYARASPAMSTAVTGWRSTSRSVARDAGAQATLADGSASPSPSARSRLAISAGLRRGSRAPWGARRAGTEGEHVHQQRVVHRPDQKTAARDAHVRRYGADGSEATETAAELDVLHEWLIGKPADAPKDFGAHEDGLVAIREA